MWIKVGGFPHTTPVDCSLFSKAALKSHLSSCLGIWIICDVSDVFDGSLVQLSQQRRVLSTTAVAAGTRLCLLPHRHPHSALTLQLDLSESFEGFDLNSADSLCSATTFKHWQDWQTLWKPLLFLSCWDLQFCMSVKVKFGRLKQLSVAGFPTENISDSLTHWCIVYLDTTCWKLISKLFLLSERN